MILENNETAKGWIDKYIDIPSEGQSELIQLAEQTSLSNDDLDNIFRSENRGALQGLVTSILHERGRTGTYIGPQPWSFDADYAGVYITVEEDNWGRDAMFKSENGLLLGAKLSGENILRGSILKCPGVLVSAQIVGNRALYGSIVEGDHVLEDAIVKGNHVLKGAIIKGDYALYNSTVEGLYALDNSIVEGDYPLYNSTVRGVGALHGATVEGRNALCGATVEGLYTLHGAIVRGYMSYQHKQ